MRTDADLSAPRPASARITSALNRFSLRSLLIGSACLFVFFCMLVVVYVRVNEGITFRMMDSLINVDNVISDLCLKSNGAMTDARRLEKDFLLYYKEFGYDESRSRYITRLFIAIADLKEHLRRIRDLAGDRETTQLTREVESALERYRQGIEALVKQSGERGYSETGVHGAMDAEARELEKLVAGLGSERLLVKLLAVILAEEEYVERERDADVLGFAAVLGEFTVAVSGARLPDAIRVEIDSRAERYRRLFGQYVRTTEEVRTIKKEYLRAVQTVEPLLEKLYIGSLERAAAKRRAIERSARRLSLPVIAAGGVVLVVTALFTLVVAMTVSRSVVESKAFAERIAAGDLSGKLVLEGKNEFVTLATALNAMAASLRAAEIAREGGAAALRHSEEKYRSLVETSTDWIWELDLEGRHIFSNDRVRNILGLEPADLLRASTFELLHPEDIPRARRLLETSRSSESGWHGIVLRWLHKDGTCRWVESNAVAVHDSTGSLVGFRGVDRDITARRQLEEELVKTQKLEAIGTLAGGIAHDFNNLLQGLFGYISLAKINLDRRDKAGEMLEQAEKALSLSVNLTTQLLTFAKGGQPLKRIISLPSMLEDPVKFALSGSRSDYRIAVDDDLWAVDADEGQLGQVIQNLVLNASEAMSRGGTVEIAARNEVVAAGANPLASAGGNFVRIDVRDAGAGIPGKHRIRIFDPYFTTKERGSGLGLATAYSIVASHDGFMTVNSRLDEGSVFSVYLPACSGKASRELAAAPPAVAVSGRVLLMDDDKLVRDVAAGMMTALGHEVTACASGEEVIALFTTARDEGMPFDLVILDLTVKQGMGGEEAMRQLGEIAPDIRAIVSSGYSDAAVMSDFQSYGFAACLSKPFRIGTLRDCLASLLKPPGANRQT